MSHHSAADLQKLRSRGFVPRSLMLLGGETFSKLCVTAAFVYLARGEQRWEFIPSSVVAVTAAGVVAGIIGTRVDGPLRGTVAACLPMAIVAARQRDAVFALVREGVRL